MLKTKRSQGGFTLIELMIVVAIVGILAAIAIPRYQDYVTRSQVTEGLNLAGPAKIAIAEFFQTGGTSASLSNPATANDIVGYSGAVSKYVQSITVGVDAAASDPIITILYDNPPADGMGSGTGDKTLILTGLERNGAFDWECTQGANSDNDSAVPSECRN
ncbi:prepilin-type N-terminal cleavage/methylation domain-containing protein [Halomonas alimentaria]|uniref:Prepilin-type N-terminal cleavage/methylation domain-containing protein n=2 Tax=Halomonas alimentaria TaxID=147248 RepID=A0A7X5AP36_9GAMM|nr:prepilin-type N-terminal cleavage/methylation domain-containing protein [Halomonas alimentaria]